MDLFLFGKSFPTGFSMQVAPPLIIPPRLTARPKTVPIITAKITAGIFFISPMELTPIPIEQTPNILVSSELIFAGSLCPNNAPITPPAATDRALIITPIGIFIPLLSIISGSTNFVLKHSPVRTALVTGSTVTNRLAFTLPKNSAVHVLLSGKYCKTRIELLLFRMTSIYYVTR